MSNVFAQTEKATYKTVADEFENNFNQGNFENIGANSRKFID